MKKWFFLFCLIFLGLGVVMGWCYFGRESFRDTEKNKVMIDFTNMKVSEVERYAREQNFLLEVEYQYSYDILKDLVISQSIPSGSNISFGETCKIVVSKGEIPVSVYAEYGVNELGMVPIMMYHGIVDVASNQTSYIGGNVDKDGYQRTAEAFRGDLEFYYQEGYRMIRLMDYIEGDIEVALGYSPIILTFDDGNENNFKVLGEENGELIIDPNCAVGILEEFKKKYPNYGVTATFFVNASLFQQKDYNDKILTWLIEHGYDIGNHTMTHPDFTKIGTDETMLEVGGLYQLLESIIPGKYVPIVALPFGSPYQSTHVNYGSILKGEYHGQAYETQGSLRVGWEAEVSCFDKNFNPSFLKRIRAYDNLGKDFDIAYNFDLLKKNRYVSDGDRDTIVVLEKDREYLMETSKRVRWYSSSLNSK